MNREDIRELVKDATGRTDKDSVINRAINIALNKLSSERLWNDLLTEDTKTLTVGTNTITLASNLRRISDVRIIKGLNSSRIIGRNKSWFVRFFPDPSAPANARPRYAYLRGTTLVMTPPPDDTYQLDYTYFRFHPDFSDDTTNTLIPHADEAVVAYSIYWTFKSLEKHDDANQWLLDYLSQIAAAKRADKSSYIEHIPTPRGSRDALRQDYWLDPFVPGVPGVTSGF